jgi:hypothetical protein
MGCYKGLVAGLAAVVLSAAVVSPTSAAIVTIDASAAVDTINDASASDGVQIGDVAHYHVVFDDSTLVDITAAANALYGGSTTGIRVASLSDPGASFTATFDGDTYTQDVSEGVDASGLGVPYPYVIYHDQAFWGFDILVQRGDGFELGLFGEEELSLGEPQTLQGGQDFCWPWADWDVWLARAVRPPNEDREAPVVDSGSRGHGVGRRRAGRVQRRRKER